MGTGNHQIVPGTTQATTSRYPKYRVRISHNTGGIVSNPKVYEPVVVYVNVREVNGKNKKGLKH